MPSAKELIDQRVAEKCNKLENMPMKYKCKETGKEFEAYESGARFSPFTGGKEIEMVMQEQSAMSSKDVPKNQKDPKKQVPLKANPAGGVKKPKDWKTKQLMSNPAPDAQGKVGATRANASGKVPYPSMKPASTTTTSMNSTAGDRT